MERSEVKADSLLSNTTSLTQQLDLISKPKLKWFLRDTTLMDRKKEWTNIENDKQEKDETHCTIQQVIPNVCTKYQNPSCSGS